MALPKQYLTSAKNLAGVLDAIQTAQAPKSFTLKFLENLGYKSSSDRLVIGVLKNLGFLTQGGQPTERYFEYLDQTQSERVLADGIREAYGDLYQINTKAQDLSKTEVKNKFKTLAQGQYSDAVLGKMATTFKALVGHADFQAARPDDQVDTDEIDEDGEGEDQQDHDVGGPADLKLGGLVYNIQIVLPESRDRAVYDALFRSLRDHLP